LYYFNDKVDRGTSARIELRYAKLPFVNAVRLGGTTTTDVRRLRTQRTRRPTSLNLTAGVRDRRKAFPATSLEVVPSFGLTVTDADSATFHDVSPKFSVDYHFTDGLMTYLTISKGFQSGGFDISAQPPLVAFQPETVWDYEAGLKWRTKQASIDLAAFHYDYTNLQVAQIVNGLPATTNAADSKIDGAELEATVQATPSFQITEALAYLHARFTKFTEVDTLTGELDDLAGNQLPGAPKWSSNLLLNYTVPIAATRLELTGEWNWHDRLYFTEFNSAQVSQAPTSTYNASARVIFNHEKTYLEFYGKNLSNELILSQAWITGAGFGSMVLGHIAPPRTYGAMIHHSFN
jgi:iron complex outermembrane receptor protein